MPRTDSYVERDVYVGDDALSMPFGKFKGRPMGWIADNQPEYLDWLVRVEIQQAWLRDAVRRLHRKYVQRIPENVRKRP